MAPAVQPAILPHMAPCHGSVGLPCHAAQLDCTVKREENQTQQLNC